MNITATNIVDNPNQIKKMRWNIDNDLNRIKVKPANGHFVFACEEFEDLGFTKMMGYDENTNWGQVYYFDYADDSPAQLPWFLCEENIPSNESKEAWELIQGKTSDYDEANKLFRTYVNQRIGAVDTNLHGRYCYPTTKCMSGAPQFMYPHRLALSALKLRCIHSYKVVGDWSDWNIHLYTGAQGNILSCTKCGKQTRTVTYSKNYSGD